MYLTQSEMEIMQAYWTAEKEMSLAELIEASPNRCWKDRSGFSIINSLIKKGLLKEVGYTHSGKTIARTFAPEVSCTEYMMEELMQYEGKISLPQLVSGIIGTGKVDADEIEELDRLVKEKKKEIGK
ncbi:MULTISPECIES: BlaI/MecI/CopY family transcriptional regulator [unclassified Butyrivibrio]|uniref:BlaI/MecI/CopY family transcriptional regulator n=1 Tax=unclassified Butyrivibrio TaxID=2639466 RepID=UPI0003FFF4EA|nr:MULTISPECIES: BlaI/MecI/CopY family transcriptional regulator [unclassified Butyrivibrio]SDB67674.1 Predicted transcriptional regulator [Butyrivibrio sp. INlla16]